LDVCTGTAEIAHRCARRGAWVCGVDITEAMLRRAAKKMRQQPVSFFRMDARMLAFKDESFDVAVVSFALHDMPRRVRVEVLREARRVSKCVVVLDYDFPTHRFARVCWIWLISLFESPYFPSFANEDMRNLFKEAGISILERQHAFPYLFSVYVLGSSQHQPEK
jgi:ubiquinone/menaquinone biosynthesis C-methylase UbiE